MTYQTDHANRQTAYELRPLRFLVSKLVSALLSYGAQAVGLAWSAALQIFVFLCNLCRFGKTAAEIG